MFIKYFSYKEIKKSPSFFIIVSMMMVLGTFSLIALSLVGTQVENKLKEKSKIFLTSDFSINARRDFSSEESRKIDQILNTFDPLGTKSYKVIDLYSMVTFLRQGSQKSLESQESKTSKLVEIRATEPGFPFYGEIKVNRSTFSSDQLFISRALADLWKIRPGDALQVGNLSLPVSGIVEEDSSIGLRGVSLAPRIYFPLKKLSDTGLLRPGVTGSFSLHYHFSSSAVDVKELKREIYKSIEDSFIKVTLPEESSQRTGRALGFIINFMSLASIVGLLLSLIGVFYLYQSQMISRLKDYCLFYLHGMKKGEIVRGVLSQYMVLLLISIFIDFLILYFFSSDLSHLVFLMTGLNLGEFQSWPQMLLQLLFLFLLSLSILYPLLLGLLRNPLLSQLHSFQTTSLSIKWFDFLPFLMMLFLFSLFVSRSVKIGSLFFSAIILIFVPSLIFIKLLQYVLKKILPPQKLSFPTIHMGLALKGIQRSGHRLIFTFLSLTLSVSLMAFIIQLNETITQEFSFDKKRPSLFIFDIQEEQLEDFESFVSSGGMKLEYVTPLVRARLLKVNQEIFVKKNSEDRDEESRSNTLNLTFRNYLTDAEKIVEGKDFDGVNSEIAQVSLEKRWAERMGIELNDSLLFDVQGVEVEGRVVNIKEIKWTSFYPNFFVTLSPGIIDEAPKTFIASLPSEIGKEKINLQRLALEKFPNISFIDVEDFLKKLEELFIKSRMAISLMAGISLLIGLLILYGLSYDQVLKKKYDLALLKSMGLTPRSLQFYLILEFGILFFLAQFLGIFSGWLTAQLIGIKIFKVSLSFHYTGLGFLVLVVSGLCFITLWLTSRGVIKQKPHILLSEV